MKKVGLCIKYQNKNYGSMLQTVAFTKFLDELPIDYELIRYKKKRSVIQIIKNLPRFLNIIFINDRIETLKKILGLKFHKEFAKNNEIRDRLFDNYCESEFTKLSPIYYGYSELIKGSDNYRIV
ncbi:MAG: polysaccharide pyruvyl transferase family protein, partial [Candidatus Coproplasma sp.]